MGSVLGNFFSRGPVTQSTIEENMYGQVLVSTTAVTTYKAVVGQGNWAIQRLAQYHITYVHCVMQRYYYYRMMPARRTGHLDMQASGSESMFSFQRTGHRVGATAHARAEELFGPEEYAIRKRNWMIDQIVFGHMATHQHDLIAAVYMESLIREYILSGGNRWTNEKFVEWELLEDANVFGCLNDHHQYAAGKLAEYARRVDGTSKIGILPRKAVRMHQNLPPTKINQALGRIILDAPVQFSLGMSGTIDRSVPFPVDATLDPYNAPRSFGNLDGIKIYLEPSNDLTTGNSDTNTLLVNHHATPQFCRHGLIRDSGYTNPNIVRIYDLAKPGLNTVNASSRAGLIATGVFNPAGPSFAGGHGSGNNFPPSSSVMAGYSAEFRTYIKELNNSNTLATTTASYLQQGANYAESGGFYSEDDAKKDLHHCLATRWDDSYPRPAGAKPVFSGWSPAPVIGAMMPHSLRHGVTLHAAESMDKMLSKSVSDRDGRNFHELASQIQEVARFFNSLKFSKEWIQAFINANRTVVNREGVNEYAFTPDGAYIIPPRTDENFLAGYGAGVMAQLTLAILRASRSYIFYSYDKYSTRL